MDLSPISQNLSLLTSFGLAKGLTQDPQQALYVQAMNQAHAKQALTILKVASEREAPNETTATLRENLTKYFEAVLSGEVSQGSSKEAVRPAKLDGLVDRVIHGLLPFNEKQAFIGEVARGIQSVPEKDQNKYLDDAITRLVDQEVASPRKEEATPAEISRLQDYYEGLMKSLSAAQGFGLGALGSGLFLDFKG